jgi:hypothetical protein
MLGAVALVAYGWWCTGRQPFTRGALVAVLVGAVGLLALAARHRRRTEAVARPQATPLAIVVWCATVVAVVGWELLALFSLPRDAHPTISSLVEAATHHHVARLALYVLWLALGWVLAS